MYRTIETSDRTSLLNTDFVFLCISALAFFTSFYLLISTLPAYVTSVGGGDVALGIVIGSFAISSLVLRPVVGRAVDRRGRKILVVLGTVIFVASSALYWFARSVPALIGVRVLHGAGMAFFTTAATTMVADLAPPARRGEAMGIFGIAANVALAVGPALGAALLAAAGFGWLFGMSAAIAVIGVALALPVRDRGFVQSSGVTSAGLHSLFSREVLLPSLVIFTVMLSYGPLIAFLPGFVGVGRAGIFFTAYSVAIAAARAVAGRLSDRHGRRAIIVPGMALIAAAMLLLAWANGLAGLLLVAALYGAGMAAAQPALYALAVDRAKPHSRGIAMGTFTAAFELGIGGGAIAAGFIVRSAGYQPMFAAAGAAALVGLVLILARGGQSRSATQDCNL